MASDNERDGQLTRCDGVTAYQAKYFAYALTREGGRGLARLHFKEATERLMRWSEDQVAAATHRIETLRARQLERAIRHARTLDEQVPLQNEFDRVRKDIRRARVNVSTVEDETDEKRRRLLDALQRKLIPEVTREELFIIKWGVA